MQPTAPAGSGLNEKEMATINSIKKQIETATKRIESFNGKIAMYETRANNAIAKAIKATGIANINAENYHEILNTRDNWDWDYKIGSNFNYKAENEKNLAREVRNLESLTAELAKMEQAASEKETANASLKAALNDAMVDFKKVWFERMTNWYSKNYDRMRAALPKAIETRDKANRIKREYFWSWSSHLNHSRMYKIIENKEQAANEIIYDDANRMEKPEYMAMVNEMLINDWNAGIDKLTDKCRTFGVDETKVKANHPSMTEKGFEVVLTDGTNRIIYARVIWAAEYSDIVTPHTRYIVTERR